MTPPQLSFLWSKATLGLLTGLLVSLGGLATASAQAKVQFNVPDIEAPGNRESAAQRSGSEVCLSGPTPLLALVPETNVGLTTAAYPEFYVYVPPTQAKAARFVVVDQVTNLPIYEEEFTLKGASGGIVTVALPNNGIQQPLQVDQSYYWYFSLVCDRNDADANPVVESTVRRVEPGDILARSLAESQPETLPTLYAEAGIWYGALSASAALSTLGEDTGRLPAQPWRDLLEAVGLASVADATLLSQ